MYFFQHLHSLENYTLLTRILSYISTKNTTRKRHILEKTGVHITLMLILFRQLSQQCDWLRHSPPFLKCLSKILILNRVHINQFFHSRIFNPRHNHIIRDGCDDLSKWPMSQLSLDSPLSLLSFYGFLNGWSANFSLPKAQEAN
jgi:hypothetical protein